MVKVESLTAEEKALREKTSRLVEITKDVLGVNTSQMVSLSPAGNICVSHHSSQAPGSPIFINPDANRILVESEPYFTQAMGLARAYENSFPQEEFTVKEMYR